MEAAKDYLVKSLSAGDYYAKDIEEPGHWFGVGADKLGLRGKEVAKAVFDGFVEGKGISQRIDADRIPGYDITFSPPKSVSLAYLVGEDERILPAFKKSLIYTMNAFEQGVFTRVRKDGANSLRHTGNALMAEFIHKTARPVGGRSDPHLHGHVYFFNATYDKIERIWKAAHIKDIYSVAPYYQAIFHAKLKTELRRLGYEIDQKNSKGDYEIAGIGQGLLDKFSKRKFEIDKLAERLGVQDDAKRKSNLAARSRKAKRDDLSFDELRTEWKKDLTVEESAEITGTRVRAERNKDVDLGWRTGIAREAVAWAARHKFERESTHQKERFWAACLDYTEGGCSELDVKMAAKENPNLILVTKNGKPHYTLTEVMNEEKAIIRHYQEGRYLFEKLYHQDYYDFPEWMTDDQKMGVWSFIESENRFTYVSGGAGTGKTTMNLLVDEYVEKAGWRVFSFAPTAAASRGTMVEAGFKDADTVAKFLMDKKTREGCRDNFIRIDEVGLLSNKDILAVMDHAVELNARVFFTGDPKQHGSVGRGNVCTLLENHTDNDFTEMHEIVRQSDGEYKKAVSLITEGGLEKIQEALGLVKEDIVEERMPGKRYEMLANYYVEKRKEGMQPLVIAPSKHEGAVVTSHIRGKLREEGFLKHKEYAVKQLVRLNWTEAEKSDFRNTEKNKELVEKRGNFYVEKELRVSAGDVIQITENKGNLMNGSTYMIKGVNLAKKQIMLDNGHKLSTDFAHIKLGYAVTSFSSQSRSEEGEVIVAQHPASGAGSAEQFYVSFTRSEKKTRIYTTTKEELEKIVAQPRNDVPIAELLRLEREERLLGPIHKVERGFRYGKQNSI